MSSSRSSLSAFAKISVLSTGGRRDIGKCLVHREPEVEICLMMLTYITARYGTVDLKIREVHILTIPDKIKDNQSNE